MMRRIVIASLAFVLTASLAACDFTPYDLPLPGGAPVGDDPYSVTIEFEDALDLVPHSAVRVDDVAVGRVSDIELSDWTARVTVLIDGDVELPTNAVATIRQSSLLGEKFISLARPAEPVGRLAEGDVIALDASGRNPEIEEVLAAASLVLNGGSIDRTNTIVRELSAALDGNEDNVKALIDNANAFVGELDANKVQILQTLEQVDRLAETTNAQEEQIVTALEELPEALAILEQQRDDITTLMTELGGLGDVATTVVAESKADVVANLKHLEPSLRHLADSDDSLVEASSLLLSFPFPDEFVGGTVASASGACTSNNPANNEGRCGGDFGNLSLRLELSTDQLFQALDGLDANSFGNLADLAPAPLNDPARQLADLLQSLVPQPGTDQIPGLPLPPLLRQPTAPKPTQPNTPSPTPSPEAQGGGSSLNPLCWLGLCRSSEVSGPTWNAYLLGAVVDDAAMEGQGR